MERRKEFEGPRTTAAPDTDENTVDRQAPRNPLPVLPIDGEMDCFGEVWKAMQSPLE
jgi:hypothetical protein